MPENQRTPSGLKLLLSLVAIILISWANSRFFGIVWVRRAPAIVTQLVHIAALLAIAAIGAWYWRLYPGRWLLPLWLLLYGGVLALLGLLAALYALYGPTLSPTLVAAILAVRNAFTSPLPFFAVYLLIFAVNSLDSQRK